MITDPKFAPKRSDLTFLRKRVRPKEPEPAAAAPTARPNPAPSTPRIDYSRPDRETAQPSAAPTVDYTHHGAASATPTPTPQAPAPPAPPVPASAGGSLDLSEPSPEPAAAAPVAKVAQPPAALPAWLQRHVVRVRGPEQRIMGVHAPTVTLTRVQSGIGELRIEAMASAELGDLRLGAAYQLRSGGSGIVAHADGNRFGPSSRRPVIVGSREDYEQLGLDLRQVDDIERIAVFAYSESRTELTWGGTLVITLERGARLEIPLEKLRPGRIAVLVTLYNMDGELIVRAETETIDGDVREAARAYGFDRITWRDDRNPVD